MTFIRTRGVHPDFVVDLHPQDYAVLMIVIAFPAAAIPVIRHYLRRRIPESLLLVGILVLTGAAALFDFLSHQIDEILLWKTGQFLTYTVFLIVAIFALVLQYNRIPNVIAIPLAFLYISASSVLFLAPDEVRTSSDTVSASFKINTSLGELVLISDTISLLGDLLQLFASILAFVSFMNMYLVTRSERAKRASLGQLIAFGALAVAMFWETLESILEVKDLRSSFILAGAIFILAVVYTLRPEYILLSPITIRNMLVVTESGIPLFKVRFRAETSRVDSVLVGGALSAIDSIMRTITEKQSTALRSIVLQDRILVVERNSGLLFMVTVNRPTRILRSAVSTFARDYVANVRELVDSGRFDMLEPFQQFDLVAETFPFIDKESMVTWDDEFGPTDF